MSKKLDPNSALARLQITKQGADAIDDDGLKAAFENLKGGDWLYDLFILAVSEKIEKLYQPENSVDQETLVNLAEVMEQINERAEETRQCLEHVNDDRLWQIMDVIMRNAFGKGIPREMMHQRPAGVPAQVAAPQTVQAPAPDVQPQASAQAAPVKRPPGRTKKFAASNSTDIPPAAAEAPAKPAASTSNAPPAPRMPPRGNGIIGI